MNGEKLHEEFVRCGRASLEWRRKCELMLPDIHKHEIWKKRKYGSIFEYAAKLAGMSQNVVEECLRVHRRIHDKPELMSIAEEKGLQALRPIAAIATQETAGFWAEKAQSMAKHTLETYVKNYREETLPGEATQHVKLTLELDAKIADELEKLKGDSDWNELMLKLLRQETPGEVKATSRHIPNHIQHFIKEKYAGRCHYPSCQRQGEIFHHTQRFALEKVHDPTRLVYLCKEHERIAHLGLFDNEEESTFAWKLRKTQDKTNFKYYIDRMVQLHRSP